MIHNTIEKDGFQNETEKKSIRINGFQQVIDLLQFADPHFRESLLERLSKRDARLVGILRTALKTESLPL